ncbi:MAG: mercuric transporter MerT family protein [Hyphomicrobiaceae bacterium]
MATTDCSLGVARGQHSGSRGSVVRGRPGAWIGALTPLAPYQPIFLGAAAASTMAGFWLVYRHKPVACAGPDCGTPHSRRINRLALWAGLLAQPGTRRPAG